MSLKNVLNQSTSPYLLQHQNQPVAWQEWSEETFELAKTLQRPVFLSIGYSTCHWCHVMAHESFDDPEVAALLNQHFVSIKLDREERPDIDQLYMTVCQMMTGRGGWPLTVLLTPDKRPFFAGTYFPKYGNSHHPGLMDVLTYIQQVWTTDIETIVQQSQQIVMELVQRNLSRPQNQPYEAICKKAFEQFQKGYDTENGGFFSAPKFPSPHQLQFLLRYGQRTQTPEAINMVVQTLTKMRLGGIFDQVGYGFHRYATDATWKVPHFEKMAYDQAMLLLAYTEAFSVTQNPLFKQTAYEIVQYLEDQLQSEQGVYFCAQDADTEGEEGKFYVWSQTELEASLGNDFETFAALFSVEEQGNFLDEATHQKMGTNILHLQKEPPSWDAIKTWMQTLKAQRETRKAPHLDDKVLTDWNGLVMAALAKASAQFKEPHFMTLAQNVYNGILMCLTKGQDTLYHSYRNGKAHVPALSNDYIFLAYGVLELAIAEQSFSRLKEAQNWMHQAVEKFYNTKEAIFYMNTLHSDLIVNQKELYDGAMPSGNAVAVYVMGLLSLFLGDVTLKTHRKAILENHLGEIESYPSAYTFWAVALETDLLEKPVPNCGPESCTIPPSF